MEDYLSERLIRETIALGGSNEANRDFSTKGIARRSGVSEPTLFARFPTKNELIDAANAYCGHRITIAYTGFVKEGLREQKLVDRALDRQIRERAETIYLLNYSHSVDHGGRNREVAISFRNLVIASGKDILSDYSFGNDEGFYIAFASLVRIIVVAASFVIRGVWPDCEAVRVSTYRRITGGIGHYLKGNDRP
jgi:AcrR family transcriptional regulator